MGQCPECHAWNSFEERNAPSKKQTRGAISNNPPLNAVPITSILSTSSTRYHTGSTEFDRVLGGGLLPGSVILLGGEPGIGKSTLLLQTAQALSSQITDANAVLYCCTEESLDQVSQRASRIGVSNDTILLSPEYRIEHIEQLVETHNPKCIIIDSIQALRSTEVGYTSGQGAHIRNCASICCEWSQKYNAIVFIVAHITKEGIIAGPKLIEHMVDTVLMFEKEKHNLRFLYAQKNRHGAVDEVGIVLMSEQGLQDISDVGTYFLQERNEQLPPGICVAATFEGTRPFLVEIQSLTVPAVSQNRVFSDRIDARQISRIAAVLERHLKLSLSNHNLYVNVAGGIRISEPGLELALALSLYSAYQNISLPIKTCAIGEISLPGEIHSVDNFQQRCRQAIEYGFTRIIAPKKNVEALNNSQGSSLSAEIIGVRHITQAVKAFS